MGRREVAQHLLPTFIREVTGQREIPFGDCTLQANDTFLGTELCEELFTPDSPSTHLGLDGVEIICNSSAVCFSSPCSFLDVVFQHLNSDL